MLVQLVTHHPEAIVPILRNTPVWVWGLLAGLLALGFSQARDRTQGAARVALTPIGMTAFSAWGMVSAFGASPLFPQVLGLWIAAAVVACALLLTTRAAAEYDPATRTFRLPGSLVPLALIVGIFAVKYFVGVELAMAPRLAQDAQYTLIVAGLYGAFSGVFVGRAARLWRLAVRQRTAPAFA